MSKGLLNLTDIFKIGISTYIINERRQKELGGQRPPYMAVNVLMDEGRSHL
jgi:hypothetical protein